MRAHPSWQRPLSGHIFFSFFCALNARRLNDDSYMLHLTSPLQGGGSHLLDLLIIIEIHPIIISTERSRAVEHRKRSCRPPRPVNSAAASSQPRTEQHDHAAVRHICKPKQRNAADKHMRRRDDPQPQQETTRIKGGNTNRYRFQIAMNADP
jgi:hypothetical protein